MTATERLQQTRLVMADTQRAPVTGCEGSGAQIRLEKYFGAGATKHHNLWNMSVCLRQCARHLSDSGLALLIVGQVKGTHKRRAGHPSDRRRCGVSWKRGGLSDS